MPITLGNVTFDANHTSASEAHAEVGGRDARTITLAGLILGESSSAAIERRLDAILAAASEQEYGAVLSLRAGRRLWVRRESFERSVRADELTGAFTLALEARDPFEYADTETTLFWEVTASGQALSAATQGSAFALPVVTLLALDTLVDPTIGDGIRSLQYAGTVLADSLLVFDSATRTVTLDGVDVAPYTVGVFPRIDPAGSTLRFTDAPASSHRASITVAYADRWW